jgi:hypothetical protein
MAAGCGIVICLDNIIMVGLRRLPCEETIQQCEAAHQDKVRRNEKDHPIRIERHGGSRNQ